MYRLTIFTKAEKQEEFVVSAIEVNAAARLIIAYETNGMIAVYPIENIDHYSFYTIKEKSNEI